MRRMPVSRHVSVEIDLGQIRRNAESLTQRVAVPLLAVVKADAYGLGAGRIVPVIDDLVSGYCVFSFAEAADLRSHYGSAKPLLVLSPDGPEDPSEFIAQNARPAVSDAKRAASLAGARPVLCVDTGMQRFACPAEQIDAVLRAGGCDEAYTHATNLEQVEHFKGLLGGRGLRLHAAGSSLLDRPAAWLDAVRPGMALYRGAVRVSTTLADARRSKGAVGYSGFESSHHGVILAGYSNGLRRGPCLVNGVRRSVREVGMQSAFVDLGPDDRAGAEVVLLGDNLTLEDLAPAWQSTPHEVLLRMCGVGLRFYPGA